MDDRKMYIHRPTVSPQTANCIQHIAKHGFIEWIKYLTILVPTIIEKGDSEKVMERVEEFEEILAKFTGWYCTDMPRHLIADAEITMVLMVNFIGYLRGFAGLKASKVVMRINQMIDAKQKKEAQNAM